MTLFSFPSADRGRKAEPTVRVPAVPTGMHPPKPHDGVSPGGTFACSLLGAGVDSARRADLHQQVYSTLSENARTVLVLLYSVKTHTNGQHISGHNDIS